jgi:hypothetical protein
MKKIEEFKVVLDKILRYEKTNCPFKRGFEVELPPEPETPERFTPYKPRVSSTSDGRNGAAQISSSSPYRYKEPTESSDKENNELDAEATKTSEISTSASDSAEETKTSERSSSAPDPEIKTSEVLSSATDSAVEGPSSLGLFTPEKSQPEPISVRKRPFEKNATGSTKMVLEAPFDDSENQLHEKLEDETTSDSSLPSRDPSQETESIVGNDSSDEYMTARSHSSSLSSFEGPSESDTTDDTSPTPRHDPGFPRTLNGDHLKTPTRSRSRSKTRALTAPPQLSLGHSQPSKAITRIPISSETSSLSSSSESFQSFQATTSPLPPSPPDSNPPSPVIAGLDDDLLTVPGYRGHKRDVSDATITPDLAGSWDGQRQKEDSDDEQVSDPSTPALVSDSGHQDGEPQHILTPPSVNRRRHRTLAQQRSLSPLPLAANLYRPSPRPLSRHLTTSIIQTTWAILNSPPSHLFQLMRTVARKIKDGVLRGSLVGTAESGEPVTIQWNHTQGEVDENAEWDEDDFGFFIQSPSRKAGRQRIKQDQGAGAWDLD